MHLATSIWPSQRATPAGGEPALSRTGRCGVGRAHFQSDVRRHESGVSASALHVVIANVGSARSSVAAGALRARASLRQVAEHIARAALAPDQFPIYYSTRAL